MTVKELGKIKDLKDLREMNTNDVIELLDELRALATKRGRELFGEGRHQARRALGAPEPGAVGGALLAGVIIGAAVAAPLPPRDPVGGARGAPPHRRGGRAAQAGADARERRRPLGI